LALTQITPSPAPAGDDFWALARSAGYLRGRGVTFGPPLIQPGAINPQVYSISVGITRTPGVAAVDADLRVIADGSLDHLLVTPVLAAMKDPRGLLQEGARKLKVGGHLILLVDTTPKDPAHHTFLPSETREVLSSLQEWRMKDEHEENGKYLLILKKEKGRRGIRYSPGSSRPRVCVARYGALGDAIIMSPLVRQLAEDGWEVTLNISSYCAPVFENNPHISNIIIQERDLIPNHLLGRYWKYWETQYDRYINLSESIEGDLLIVEGRPPFFTSHAWREERCARNYYDHTMDRGGYPNVTGTRGELFFTNAEERRAQKFFQPMRDQFVVVWALNGSSHHKIYPLMEPLLREWFRTHPDARVVTTGDTNAKQLEFDHYQLLRRAGEWSIRESLISTKYADLVVGPETMMTNAAGCFSTPKIVLLSHSSRENLTKYFLNDYSLEPNRATAPCYPCHQLHYTKESCPVGGVEDVHTGVELGQAPICALSIAPEVLMARLDEVYKKWNQSRGVSYASA